MPASSSDAHLIPDHAAASVLVLKGERKRYEVARTPVLIGRQSAQSVEFPLAVEFPPSMVQVSRRHADLSCDSVGDWSITDRNSASGTSHNGQRLAPFEPRRLSAGDRVLIADQLLEVSEVRCVMPPRAAFKPDDPNFVKAAGHESGANLGVMHTYRVRPLSALGAEDVAQALELVLQLSRQLARAADLDAALVAVGDAIARLLGSAERVALWYQRGGETMYAWRDRGGCHLARAEWLSQTVVDWVLKHGEVLISSSPMSDARFDAADSLVMARARGLAVAPISDGERVVGVLYVDTQASVVYPRASQRLADIIATIAEASQGAVERLLKTRAHRDEQDMRQNLQRFLAPQVVARLRSEGKGGQRLVSKRVEASVLFADIAGFTALSSRLSPEAVSTVLNLVFSALVPVVFAHEGTLDKFIGDCLMAVFGAPDDLADHADRAVRTGLELITAFDACVGELELPIALRLRVAVHSGPLVAGEMGSEARREYTVLGTTVNIAARIEGVAEPGAVTISEATRERLRQPFPSIERGLFPLKGIPEPVRLFRMLR